MADDLPLLLLVDDDTLICESLAFNLRNDFKVRSVSTREEARRYLQTAPEIPKLALVDLGLPPDTHSPEEGFAVIRELLNFNPSMKILVLSGQDTLENVRHALTLGAVDFIPKPMEIPLLRLRLKHQLLILGAENLKPQERAPDCGLIGSSPALETLRAQIRQFADSPFPVLIYGESGVGKELVAQCLHYQSRRKNQPCFTINCAAFNAELLDAQLFGHAKGAYTGAACVRAGFFEESGQGCLILDEIGEMPLELQSKLLRVLENGEYYRLGETKVRHAEARIITASNRDLREEVRQGRFRNDLYHRLTVLTIKIPPLSERGEDKLELLQHFQAFYAHLGVRFQLDDNAKQRWMAYSFPGNIRELRNIVIRLGAKCSNQNISREQLEAELEQETLNFQEDGSFADNLVKQMIQGEFSLDEMLMEWERRYINAALQSSQGNLSQAARMLGINRTTLYSKMQRMNKGE